MSEGAIAKIGRLAGPVFTIITSLYMLIYNAIVRKKCGQGNGMDGANITALMLSVAGLAAGGMSIFFMFKNKKFGQYVSYGGYY